MEITAYSPGTPCWVDLSAPDPSTTSDFYAELFGWTVHDTGEEGGGYRMCLRHGKPVAGIGPQPPGADPSAPRFWSTFVSVLDAEATTEAVREAGGTVRYEPMDVADAGRMAVFTDPTGAEICAWQPRQHPGSALINEPGTPCWHELATRSPERAVDFYRQVFGWDAVNSTVGEADYTTWRCRDEVVAGMIRMTERWPADLPAHWMAYFAVGDTDREVESLRRLGGGVLVPPTDVEPGRFAVVRDPGGGAFGIIAVREG